jgi:translation initiation factor 2A
MGLPAAGLRDCGLLLRTLSHCDQQISRQQAQAAAASHSILREARPPAAAPAALPRQHRPLRPLCQQMAEATATTAPPPPPLQLLVRHKRGTELRNVAQPDPFVSEPVAGFDVQLPDTAPNCVYSPSGELAACAHPEAGITVVDTFTGAVRAQFIGCQKVSMMAWSPLSSYLVTWNRWTSGENNLHVFCVGEPGEPVASFSQKSPPTPEMWPTVQWTADEQVAAHIVTNEVHFYPGGMVGKERTTKLRVEGLKGFSLSPAVGPSGGYHVSVYKPEHKGSPAQIRLYAYPNFGEGAQIATKSFFNVESVDFKWESKGRGVLVRASTAIDKGSKAKFGGSDYYYGSSSLYYMTADGSFEGSVPLDKEGPVQDVAWVPGNMQFVVIYGYMPAVATLFDHKCKPVFSYGAGYLNTIKVRRPLRPFRLPF